MKASRYNFLFKHTEEANQYILFNSFTKALLLLDPAEKAEVEMILTDPDRDGLNRELYRELIQSCFLIDDAEDEYKEICRRYQEMMVTDKGLVLTIVPTLQCNFNCIYCYQQHSRRHYKEEAIEEQFALVKNRIFRLIEKQLRNGVRKVKISWYGGEPTIVMDEIIAMTQTIGALCQKYDAGLVVNLSSNGYLMDEKAIHGLMPYLRGVTVTVDGPEDIHNSRRRFFGESTYAIILDNLARLRTISPNTSIYLRVTIDRTNLARIPEFLDDLKQRDLSGISLRFRSLYADPKGTPELYKLIFSDEECARIVPNLLREAMQRNLITDISPSPMSFIRCDAPLRNAFVVMPNGMLHKCWGEVGTEECIIGELSEEGDAIFNDKIDAWLTYSPLDQDECTECKILPMCMGECCYNDVVSKIKKDYLSRSNGGCSLFKYNLDEFISIFAKIIEKNLRKDISV